MSCHAHASGKLARERTRVWHTVAHQWRLPVPMVPSARLAVVKFRSWRNRNLTWQLEFSLDLSPQISFHRSVGVIFLWYVVERRPLLDQADQLVFGFLGPERHVLRIFAIFTVTGWNYGTGSLRVTHALMPRSLLSRVAFCGERCSFVTAADPTLTDADGLWQCAANNGRRSLTTGPSASGRRSRRHRRVTTAEVRRHVMPVDIGRH